MKTNVNGYCPNCGSCFDGEKVIDTFMSQGKTEQEAIESASHYAGFKEHGLNNRWGRQLGIYDYSKDRTTHYCCPDCRNNFNARVF